MGPDDPIFMSVIKLISLLKFPQAAHEASQSIQGKIAFIVGTGVTLKGNGGIKDVKFIIRKVPQKIIVRHLLKGIPD